jgi:hypothetical protein
MTKKIDRLIENVFDSVEEETEVETLDERSDTFDKFLDGTNGILKHEKRLNTIVLQESMKHPVAGEHPARTLSKRYRETTANNTFWKKA